jgi:hypothetical protein
MFEKRDIRHMDLSGSDITVNIYAFLISFTSFLKAFSALPSDCARSGSFSRRKEGQKGQV